MASHGHMPTPTPSLPCDVHGQRLDALETRADDHSNRIRAAEKDLGDGRVEFAGIKRDLAQIQATLAEIKTQLARPAQPESIGDKMIDAAIHWGVPSVIVGLLWVLAKSGQVPGVH